MTQRPQNWLTQQLTRQLPIRASQKILSLKRLFLKRRKYSKVLWWKNKISIKQDFSRHSLESIKRIEGRNCLASIKVSEAVLHAYQIKILPIGLAFINPNLDSFTMIELLSDHLNWYTRQFWAPWLIGQERGSRKQRNPKNKEMKIYKNLQIKLLIYFQEFKFKAKVIS